MNRTLGGFLRKEFTQVLRDKRMRVLLFGVPVIQMTLFGIAISTEVRNVRLSASYPPGDRITRQILDHSLGSGWFRSSSATFYLRDPYEAVASGRAEAVLVAPAEGLAESLQRGSGAGRGGTLQLLVDATNVIRAQQTENYIRMISASVLASELKGPVTPSGPQLQLRVLYNPALRTPVFLVPGVMGMVICVITIVLTSMSIAKEKEVGTFEMLISAPVRTWEIIFGKTIPYILLGLVDVVLTLLVAIFAFDVPMRGSPVLVLLAGLAFVTTTVSIGTLISTISKSQQQAMLGSFIFLFPAILLSGIMFPLENMPPWMLVLAELDPLKYFVSLMRNVLLKGGAPSVVWPDIGVLLLMATVFGAFSFNRFKRSLR